MRHRRKREEGFLSRKQSRRSRKLRRHSNSQELKLRLRNFTRSKLNSRWKSKFSKRPNFTRRRRLSLRQKSSRRSRWSKRLLKSRKSSARTLLSTSPSSRRRQKRGSQRKNNSSKKSSKLRLLRTRLRRPSWRRRKRESWLSLRGLRELQRQRDKRNNLKKR